MFCSLPLIYFMPWSKTHLYVNFNFIIIHNLLHIMSQNTFEVTLKQSVCNFNCLTLTAFPPTHLMPYEDSDDNQVAIIQNGKGSQQCLMISQRKLLSIIETIILSALGDLKQNISCSQTLDTCIITDKLGELLCGTKQQL